MRSRVSFLRSLFDVAHVEFQTYDLSSPKLIFSSGLGRKILGYSESEFSDLSVDYYKKIIHPDDFHIVQETLKKVMQANDGDVIEMILRARRNDGVYIWVRARHMVYQRSPDGKARAVITEVEDITRLIEIQNELEEKVKQLKLISYKNSHLLRAPVASIIGLVDLIDEQGITSKHNKQVFHYLKEAIRKLDDVIHQINDAAHE